MDTADLPHLTADSDSPGPALPVHISVDAERRPGLGVGSYRRFGNLGNQPEEAAPHPAGTGDQAKPNQISRMRACLHYDR